MAFTWTENKIEFFKEASEYTGFHSQVADVIRPYLKTDWIMCDMGCGLGYLDFQLAPCVKRFDAIDNSELAIDDYRSRLAASGMTNINVELLDLNKPIHREWDAILLSFYGRPGDDLDGIFKMARKMVIMLAYVESLPEGQGKLKKDSGRPTTSDMEQYIIEKNYKYELKIKKFDFGQPFKSMEDASRYYETYSREADPAKRKRIIEDSLKSVKSTGDSRFPFFSSKKKDVGIFFVTI